jgi:hypothetical protein
VSELSERARYLEIKDEIKNLEVEKRELAQRFEVGERVQHEGHMYEWVAYETGSTAWKALYEGAYQLLDDEGQVLMGEAVRKAFKPRVDHKFEKRA